MKVELIATGDEVMQGIIVDSNAAWMAERIVPFGFEIVRHTTVGDDEGEIATALKEAASRADTVFVSGGLGPTADDITIEAAAKAFGAKLIKDEAVLAEIREFFERIGREMSPSNEKQALIPEGAKALKNRVGTAPGIHAGLGGADFFFLPGVPKELYQIFEDSVMPWLSERADTHYIKRVLRCFGIPEASIDSKLKGVDLAGARLSFRVKFPEIMLRLIARSKDEADARAQVEQAAVNIRERLGDVVYGEGDATLAEVTGKLLKEKGLTLAVAESCTGGQLCSTITDVVGASDYFERGVVTYSNLSKEELLGVPHDTIERSGAVSKETVTDMAEGIRREAKTDIGVAITGIAGPGGGTQEKPVGRVHIAVATPDGTWAKQYDYQRDRLWFKQIVTATALNLVRIYLLKSEL
jgi:nicotinamide-nucleotide amidase